MSLPYSQSPGDDVKKQRIEQIKSKMHDFFDSKYPCVAALQSYSTGDYQIGVYKKLGSGESWRELRHDLENFCKDQAKSKSTFLTFFAVFADQVFDEDAFEAAMWQELSMLTSVEDLAHDWQPGHANPDDKGFRFSLNQNEFFVVGLHENSNRKARRFFAPTLIFNLSSQFDEIDRRGQYEPMVKMIRKRDEKYQGEPNATVVEFAESWEAIQFSGKKNDKKWKCPFHFLHNSEKP